MKLCAYYGCSEPVLESEPTNGFIFCIGHFSHLTDLVELYEDDDDDFQPAVAYCLSSLNNKAYNRQEVIL
jgi:hypothetical protein